MTRVISEPRASHSQQHQWGSLMTTDNWSPVNSLKNYFKTHSILMN